MVFGGYRTWHGMGNSCDFPRAFPGLPASYSGVGSAASATEQFRTARGAKRYVAKVQFCGAELLGYIPWQRCQDIIYIYICIYIYYIYIYFIFIYTSSHIKLEQNTIQDDDGCN